MSTAADLSRHIGGYFSLKDFSGDRTEVLTISKISIEEVGERKDSKPCLSFAELPKKLVINVSRKNQLEGLFGDEDLEGKRVKLAAGVVEVLGSKREMIVVEAA
jgi:hypothetical protein